MIVTRRVRATMMMMMEKEGPSMMNRRMMLERKINHDTMREKLFPIMLRAKSIIMIMKKMTSNDWERRIHRVYWRRAGTIPGGGYLWILRGVTNHHQVGLT
jgi:hypothetical protein